MQPARPRTPPPPPVVRYVDAAHHVQHSEKYILYRQGFGVHNFDAAEREEVEEEVEESEGMWRCACVRELAFVNA